MEKTPASHRNNNPPPPQAQPPQRVQLNENGGKSNSNSTSADVNNKSAADPSPHNLPHQPRPNIDIILSLKDPFYRSVMTKFYQSLGTRITKGPKVREKKMANEALLLFKSRKTTTLGGALVDTAAAATAKMIPVRFFKPVSRYEVNGTFVEVDEKAALKKIRDDMGRRMESSNLWMNAIVESNNTDENVNDDIVANSNANDGNDFTATSNENNVIDLTANSNENDIIDLTANSDENDGNNLDNKSAAGPSSHLPQQPRRNIDIILSCKDPFYRDVVANIYQSLETTRTKLHLREKMAKEVLLLFKNRKAMLREISHKEDDATTTTAITTMRFFKLGWRGNWVKETFVEVDETAALREIYTDINIMTGIDEDVDNDNTACVDETDDNDLTANLDENDDNSFNSKSAAGPSYHLPQHPRPNVDIVLSLNDPFYISVMKKIYLSLETTGTKMHQHEKAKEALLLFKNRNTTLGETLHEEDDASTTTAITPVRFFKPVSRYELSETLVEVDETAALREIRRYIDFWIDINEKVNKIFTASCDGNVGNDLTANNDDNDGNVFNKANTDENDENDFNNAKIPASSLPQDPAQGRTQPTTSSSGENVKKRKRQTDDDDDNNASYSSTQFLIDSDPNYEAELIKLHLTKRNTYSTGSSKHDDSWQYEEVVNFTRDDVNVGNDFSANSDENDGNVLNNANTDENDDNDFNNAKIPASSLPQDPAQGRTQPTTSSSKRKRQTDDDDDDDDDNSSHTSEPFLIDSDPDYEAELMTLHPTERNTDSFTGSSKHDDIWQYEGVVNFVRDATLLGRRFPELRQFTMHELQLGHLIKHIQALSIGDKFRNRVGAPNSNGISTEGNSASSTETDTAKEIWTKEDSASSTTDMAKCTSVSTMPKVVVCIDEYIIDTELHPSVLQTSKDRIWNVDTLPDYFDPSIRPSVPTNSRQIYIPGNTVFARWLNKDDPGSYGAWYPGRIIASKLSPNQDERLIYDVRFDDGTESFDLDTEDIMVFEQYKAWLKDLEQYYSLPNQSSMSRLTEHTRVYAKWIDPTDPELHGSWMAGKVLNSKLRQDEHGRQVSYHILFDNGDQDNEILDVDVVPEELYKLLLEEKTNRGRTMQSGLNGIDLIVKASKFSSPLKPGRNSRYTTCTGGSPEELKDDSDDGDAFMDAFRCSEVLRSEAHTPSKVARLSGASSPDVHYGAYMKFKPWAVDPNTKGVH